MSAVSYERYASAPGDDGTFLIVDNERDIVVGSAATEYEAGRSAQALNALDKGNKRRVAAAEFKRGLHSRGRRAGAETLAALLSSDEPDPLLSGMPVQAALLAVNGIGRQRAHRMIRAAGVTAIDKRVRDLSPRQCTVIATELNLWGARWP